MRIAVVGTCQAHGYAHALSYLLPEAEIVSIEIVVARNAGQDAAVAASLGVYDRVFAQYLGLEWGPLSGTALATNLPDVLWLPTITFDGFHPDMCYVAIGGDLHGSPLGAYHSAIIAGAFAAGFAEEDVPALFNALVFRRLGYFDAFGKARELLAGVLGQFDPAHAARIDAWTARGPFMHTINHPRIRVLADLVCDAAIRGGLVAAGTQAAEVPFDDLASDTIWPVYPELAEAIGQRGGYRFKRAGRVVRPEGGSDVIGLPRMIAESYAIYRGMPAEYLRCAPVQRSAEVLRGLRR